MLRRGIGNKLSRSGRSAESWWPFPDVDNQTEGAPSTGTSKYELPIRAPAAGGTPQSIDATTPHLSLASVAASLAAATSVVAGTPAALLKVETPATVAAAVSLTAGVPNIMLAAAPATLNAATSLTAGVPTTALIGVAAALNAATSLTAGVPHLLMAPASASVAAVSSLPASTPHLALAPVGAAILASSPQTVNATTPHLSLSAVSALLQVGGLDWEDFDALQAALLMLAQFEVPAASTQAAWAAAIHALTLGMSPVVDPQARDDAYPVLVAGLANMTQPSALNATLAAALDAYAAVLAAGMTPPGSPPPAPIDLSAVYLANQSQPTTRAEAGARFIAAILAWFETGG